MWCSRLRHGCGHGVGTDGKLKAHSMHGSKQQGPKLLTSPSRPASRNVCACKWVDEVIIGAPRLATSGEGLRLISHLTVSGYMSILTLQYFGVLSNPRAHNQKGSTDQLCLIPDLTRKPCILSKPGASPRISSRPGPSTWLHEALATYGARPPHKANASRQGQQGCRGTEGFGLILHSEEYEAYGEECQLAAISIVSATMH